MPQQETFLEMKVGQRTVSVLKTYDRLFAREQFDQLDLPTLNGLVATLRLDENYESSHIPNESNTDFRDFVWEEITEAAREDGNILSFFLALEGLNGTRNEKCLCVAPDWPTAERFARCRLTELAAKI